MVDGDETEEAGNWIMLGLWDTRSKKTLTSCGMPKGVAL